MAQGRDLDARASLISPTNGQQQTHEIGAEMGHGDNGGEIDLATRRLRGSRTAHHNNTYPPLYGCTIIRTPSYVPHKARL